MLLFTAAVKKVRSQLLQPTLAIHCFLRGNPLLKPDRVLLFTAAGKKGSQTVAAAFFGETLFFTMKFATET